MNGWSNNTRWENVGLIDILEILVILDFATLMIPTGINASMTNEVRHIIEKGRFKNSWEDYGGYGYLLIALILSIVGIDLVMNFTLTDVIYGIVSILSSFILGRFIIKRTKTLNLFEEVTTNKNQYDNYALCSHLIRKLNREEINNKIIESRIIKGL